MDREISGRALVGPQWAQMCILLWRHETFIGLATWTWLVANHLRLRRLHGRFLPFVQVVSASSGVRLNLQRPPSRRGPARIRQWIGRYHGAGSIHRGPPVSPPPPPPLTQDQRTQFLTGRLAQSQRRTYRRRASSSVGTVPVDHGLVDLAAHVPDSPPIW
jgi:hypothetical protein